MKRIGLLILLLGSLAGTVEAQPDTKKDGQAPQDTLPLIVLDDAVNSDYGKKPTALNKEELEEWNRMVWRVDKVWPQVQEFLVELDTLEKELDALDKKSKKRKVVKAEIEDLKAKFEDKLKNNSIQQGVVIINLIHKYKQKTAYDLIRSHKSGMTATFYQGIARVNGMDLKDTFDPNSEEDQLLYKVLLYRGL